jgi:hypothetical protein
MVRVPQTEPYEKSYQPNALASVLLFRWYTVSISADIRNQHAAIHINLGTIRDVAARLQNRC